MPKYVVIIAALVASTLIAVGPLLAYNQSYNSRSRQNPWGSDLDTNPWNFPNCFVWSTKHHNYFWLCGKPYPPGFAHP